MTWAYFGSYELFYWVIGSAGLACTVLPSHAADIHRPTRAVACFDTILPLRYTILPQCYADPPLPLPPCSLPLPLPLPPLRYGRVGVVTPFNFPLEIPALQGTSAVFMGNQPMVKVDEKVAIVFEQFLRLMHHCGT